MTTVIPLQKQNLKFEIVFYLLSFTDRPGLKFFVTKNCIDNHYTTNECTVPWAGNFCVKFYRVENFH